MKYFCIIVCIVIKFLYFVYSLFWFIWLDIGSCSFWGGLYIYWCEGMDFDYICLYLVCKNYCFLVKFVYVFKM